ncbi:MAG: hypothetical protein KY468_11795 [Armatimonadetes bacterium]|nr:hypothetical protein [Armatimonadota bacterium]
MRNFITDDANWNRIMTALRNTARRQEEVLEAILTDPAVEDWQIAEAYTTARGCLRDLEEMEEASER